jgi:predicted NUDIX family NTP pyrophosphohydrolase
MKFLNFNRVLCLSPHPDDTEYSIAGVVLKHQDTHFDILCLTQGGDCDPTTGVDRIDEVKNSWSVSKATNYLVDEEDKGSSKRKKAESLGITIITNLNNFLKEIKND